MRIGTVISIATLSVSTAALVLVLMLFITEPWESEPLESPNKVEEPNGTDRNTGISSSADSEQRPSPSEICASSTKVMATFQGINERDNTDTPLELQAEILRIQLANACFKE